MEKEITFVSVGETEKVIIKEETLNTDDAGLEDGQLTKKKRIKLEEKLDSLEYDTSAMIDIDIKEEPLELGGHDSYKKATIKSGSFENQILNDMKLLESSLAHGIFTPENNSSGKAVKKALLHAKRLTANGLLSVNTTTTTTKANAHPLSDKGAPNQSNGKNRGTASHRGRKVDRECRIFQERWTQDYFFVFHNGCPRCLICSETISVLKGYNLKRHYSSKHAKFFDLEGQLRYDKIQELKNGLLCEQLVLKQLNNEDENIIRASFVVSEILAKRLKPFTDGDFVKECLVAVAEVLFPDNGEDFKLIDLSPATVEKRIDGMADDIKLNLKEMVSKFEAFSIALVESADATDAAQLGIFVRGVDSQFNCIEEMLSVRSVRDTAAGEDVLQEVKTVFDKFDLKWERLSGVTTDGSVALSDPKLGLVAKMKSELAERNIEADDLCELRSVLLQQNLLTKSIRFKNVMNAVTTCINFSMLRALNHNPQLQEFLQDIGSEQDDVPYYGEVRWVNKGKSLKRFYDLTSKLCVFMEERGKPLPVLKDINWLCDLAFFVDITTHLNELRAKFQSRGQLVHELLGHLKSFQKKLRLWESQLRNCNTYHFPTLANHRNEFDCDSFADELKSFNEEFGDRFGEFLAQEESFKTFATPFLVNVEQAPLPLQLELIELQVNSSLKTKIKDKSVTEFYQNYFPVGQFPKLRSFALRRMALFGSTFACEQFVSKMNIMKSQSRTGMTDTQMENTLRVATSNLSPNMDRLETLGINEDHVNGIFNTVEDNATFTGMIPNDSVYKRANRNRRKRGSKEPRNKASRQNLTKIAEEAQQDVYDIFGEYVASVLRKLPSVNAVSIKNKISSLITKE